ncbi:hypothetical protein AAVH_10969 [Aphelenchoides avenae]|nr:hypothetical protein AAVH_10969 [Aphelenchus avenae]
MLRNDTPPEHVLRVELDAEKPEAVTEQMRNCTRPNKACCQRTTYLCPLDANSNNNAIVVECLCRDGDLCNKRGSKLRKDLIKTFQATRPCETHTVFEHLLWQTIAYKKPNADRKRGYMCPVFYHFARSRRKNAFLQLVFRNNFVFVNGSDIKLFREDGCHLVEVDIREESNCTEQLFGTYNGSTYEKLLILLCAVEGNPLGERRKSYPDSKLKKTIDANLTAAKAEFPTCKNGSLSMDFESLSELVMDSSKLFDMYDNVTDGTNDNITTAHCYVEVRFIYQHQYDFTFGAV